MRKKLIYECVDMFEHNLEVAENVLGDVELDGGFDFIVISKEQSIEMAKAIIKHYGEDNE